MNTAETRLPRATAVIRDGMEAGLHVGAQLYVSLKGDVVADVGIGNARPGVPMSSDTIMLWLSSTKPIAAVAIGQLWEQEKLRLDDPVAKFIPEFGVNGKEPITIRHLLTHTGGFRGIIGLWEDQPWDAVIAALCATRLEPGWVPGHKAGYHTHTAWYILGELVRRISGTSYDQYVRNQVFLSLGMNDSWIGMPPDVYRNYGNRIAQMPDTSGSEVSVAPHFLDTERGAAFCRPGSNGHGPVRELGIFYETLMNDGTRNGARILSPQTVEALTAGHRIGMYDHTFRHVIDWGLGFIRNSNRYGVNTLPYGFGPHASERVCGHSGHQSSTAFCDPEYGLVVAWVFNGLPGEPKHDRRLREMDAAIYEDLGLAPASE